MSDTDESLKCTPPAANKSCNNLLPEKSRKRYDDTYQRFMEWRRSKKVKSLSENVFLAYFDELSKSMKSSTLWAHYSMLRSTILIKNDVNISKYFKLKSLLKRTSEGYRPKKSKTLDASEIEAFLTKAPDNKYLMIKAALIFGIMGACRRDELCKVKLNDLQDLGTALLISLPDTKTKTRRSFTITGNFYILCKKYMALRPSNLTEQRFFLNFQNGKCTKQVVGINTFGKIPNKIANFLNLPQPELYTGHCFRRTSATLLVNAGGDITALKRLGGWKSSSVAEGYMTP